MTDEPPLSTRASSNEAPDDVRFVRRVVWALLLIGLVALLVTLAQMLLLVFAAVLVAIVFDSLSRTIERLTRVPHKVGLALSVLVVLAALALAVWFFGAQLSAQVAELQETLPRAWRAFEQWLGDVGVGARVADALRAWAPSTAGLVRNLGNVAAAAGGALGGFVLVVVAGIYLAAQPRTYRSGFLHLVPPTSREAGRSALGASGDALRAWLVAQLMAMMGVAAITAVGLWAIGVPSALALGLLAGLAEFVPLVGPIFAAIPAVLLATTMGTDSVLWTVALYFAIQQIEGNVIMPMVTRRAVALPPALALFSIFAVGSLLGPLGVLLAAPLAVVAFVLVRELYLKRTLGDPVAPATAGDSATTISRTAR